MRKEIKGWMLEIAFDERNLRFFLLGTRSVCVYDINTLKKIGKLENLPYRNHIFISQKNNLIIVSSTIGVFCFYSLDDLSLQGKVTIKKCGNTDENFYYDEEGNTLYGIYIKSLRYYLYIISLETLQYRVIPLNDFYCRKDKEKDIPRIRYKFHKYYKGNFYLFVNDTSKNAHNETFYGLYELKNNKVLLKEKLFSLKESFLPLYYITEPEFAEQICKFDKSLDVKQDGHIHKTYHDKNGLFLITYKNIFHMNNDGGFQKIYAAEHSFEYPHFYESINDYAEYCGKTFILTSEKCLIQS